MNSEEFLDIVLNAGVDNIWFEMEAQPLEKVSVNGLTISYTSTTSFRDNFVKGVQAKISEGRYKVKDNYKITLKPIDSWFASQDFYICDLIQIMRSGHITMKIIFDPTMPFAQPVWAESWIQHG